MRKNSTGRQPDPLLAELYRVLYCRSGNLFVLLHMLPKRTGKLPEAGIEVAEERWADFKQRMDAERDPEPLKILRAHDSQPPSIAPIGRFLGGAAAVR